MASDSIHPKTHIGHVHYTVADLKKQSAFYHDVLGFRERWRDGDTVSLGTSQRELLRLTQVAGARRVRGRTGLYHTAFLVPTQWELANLVRQIAVTRTPIEGTSNHGTHLAIYLPDPEGNGIELAWDFPRAQWPQHDGKIDFSMQNRTGVDIDALFDLLERDPRAWSVLDDATTVGHVHLHASRLDAVRPFYLDTLGFDVPADLSAMGALFVSAGGYHHHIGMNTWLGVGAPPPPADATGLRYYTLVLPNEAERERVLARLHDTQIDTQHTPDGWLVRDPSQNGVMLTVEA
jgi:catechol 2,3-dioxygenase